MSRFRHCFLHVNQATVTFAAENKTNNEGAVDSYFLLSLTSAAFCFVPCQKCQSATITSKVRIHFASLSLGGKKNKV